MTFTPPDPFNVFDYFLGDRITGGLGTRRALVTADGEWTYGDVFDASGRIARILLEEGVGPGDRVIVSLPDSPDYVASLFATLRIGAVVVMVNPHLNADQIRWFLDYTGPTVALVRPDADDFRDANGSAADNAEAADVGSGRAGGDPPRRSATTLLHPGSGDFDDRVAGADPDVPVHPTSPDDPAIFLFSGGTTGRPKAVVQTHRSFANTTELYGKGVLGIGPDDVTLSVPKLFFGYATGTNLLFPFSVGATAALFPERCTTEALCASVEAFRPTVLVNVPTMVNNLVSDAEAEGRDFSSLRLATSAGEALPAELHRRWNDRFGVPLLDGLGTAEMWHIFISNRPDDVRPGTLGRVVEGFEIRACDDDGRDVAPGEVGTLRVRGDSLALGYWQDEDKTSAAFRDGWYVSSDMVSIDADGYVTYAGRSDDMLKVSGKWLAPKELEDCLLEHDAVHEVAVVGLRTPDGLVKPAAFVVLEPGIEGSEETAAALQEWARSRLEPYKYPREVTFLRSFPRTHLGKVDRGALARGP